MASVQVKLGTAATLTCKMTGVAEAALTVTWLKDDTPLTDSDRASLGITTPESNTVDVNGDQNAELQMTGATNTEDRTFKCKVQSGTDEAGEVEASINVYGIAITGPDPNQVSDGIDTTLTCTVSDIDASSTVSWLGDAISGTLTSSIDNQYTMDNGDYNSDENMQIHTLKIFSTVLQNINDPTTTFTCRLASVTSVDIDASFELGIITVGITLNPTAPTESNIVNIDDSFTLTCEGTGVDPAKMTVTSFWTISDSNGVVTNVSPSLVTSTSVSTSEVESTLNFPAMTSTMGGDYKCGLNYGGHTVYSDLVTISVGGARFFPTHALVVTGQALTISIETVTETTPTSVVWYMKSNGVKTPLDPDDDDYTITNTEETETETSLKITTSTLVWIGVDASNQGVELDVLVSNEDFSLESRCTTVNVLEIHAQPIDINILRGIDTYIYCSFEGPPQPSIKWLTHTSASATGTEYTTGTTQVTVLDTNIYQSRLTIDDTTAPSYWSCQATYPSYSGRYIFTGGTINTNVATLTPIGVTSVTGPSKLTVGETATFTAIADNPPVPQFTWQFNGNNIPSYTAVDGTQISTTEYEYVYTKEDMQVADTGDYGALAIYSDYGSSDLVTISTTVIDACARLAAPPGGQLTCDPATFSTTEYTIPTEIIEETSVTCTVSCNEGYQLQSSQSVYTCTDGTWEQNSIRNQFNSVNKCLRLVAPASRGLTSTVGYDLTFNADCNDYYGDYLRLAFPYHVAKFATSTDAEYSSCLQAEEGQDNPDCRLVANHFVYNDASAVCETSGHIIYLKVKFEQNENTETARTDELFDQFSKWTEATAFAPYELMKEVNCVGDCDCCILDSCLTAPSTIMNQLKCSVVGRRKRDAQSDFPELLSEAFRTGNATEVTRQDGIQCGAGTVPLDNRCMVCGEGTYQSGDQCVSCPVGTYQDKTGSTTCSSCPAVTSTTSTGATHSHLCIPVCQMEDISYGTSDPPSGWIVKLGDPITVRCSQGFQFEGQSISVTKLESCSVMPSCTRVRISTPSLNVLESTTLDLSCKITAVSSPDLCLFYKDSERFNTTDAISLGGGMFECKTSVDMVQNDDEGSYSCSAVWDEEAEPSNQIDIRVMGLTFDSSGVTYAEQSDHTFFCAATVPSDSAVIISWTRNGQPVGERMTATSNPAIGVLNLVEISPQNQGDYQCRATYLGIGTIISESASLTVLGFLESLSDMDLTTGSSATLHCKPTMGEVSWTINDTPLSTTSSSLEIQSMGTENEGVYKCQASFQGETIYSSAKISVSSAGITKHPEDVTMQTGEQVTLTCATNTDSTFKWYMNEVEVNSRTNSSKRESVLISTPLTLKTRVQCVIITNQGKTFLSKIGVLNVIGFNTVPQDRGLPEGGEVSLLCTVIGEDLSKLVWVRASDSKEVPSSSMEIHSTGYSTSNILTTRHQDTYFCRAEFPGHVIESKRAAVSPVRVEVNGKSVAVGRDVTLTCEVTGQIRSDLVFWTRNGELVFTDKNPDHVIGEATSYSYLPLDSVTDSDSGEYRCVSSILSDLSIYESEPAPLRLLGFVETISDLVVKRGRLIEVVFSVRHQAGVIVSCDLSDGDAVMGSGDINGDVIRFQGEVISVDGEVREIEYSCSVHYGSDVVIKSELAKIYIVDEPTLGVANSYVLIGEVALFTLTTDYISNVPAVHWRVNSLTTVQSSESYTGSEHTSTLQWPVTQDIEVEATVHFADFGGYSVRRDVVLAYGVEGITGPEKIHLGDSYNLTCSVATIDEDTTITWYNDNSQLLPHPPFYQDEKIYSVLKLNAVSVSDIGIYMCNAEFSDGKQSTGAFYLTQTNDCKLPTIENAIMDTSAAVISHLSELSVACGDETIVLKCEHGKWDRTLVFCPATGSLTLTIQLVTGIAVLLVLLGVAVSAVYYYKRQKRTRAVTPLHRPDSVEAFKRQWREYADDSDVIENPSAEDQENKESVNIATQYKQTQEKSLTKISA